MAEDLDGKVDVRRPKRVHDDTAPHSQRAATGKWSGRRTLAFIAISSLLIWALLIGLATLVLG